MSLLRRTVAERRERALRRVAPGPLADLLASPSPPRDTPLAHLPLLAVDVETTGLDPARDRVLSLGWVPVDGGRIDLGRAGGHVVADAGEVGRSATVHGITDDALAAGLPLEEALGALLRALAGRVMLAHFARVETTFLGAACERLWGAGLPVEVVDTLELERRALGPGWDAASDPGALRLWTARARHGLPVYRAHEAVTDALACAELYLAQRAHLEAPGTTTTLRHVVA
ncbi:exonuclease domain-containing protein [Arthrobacter sp. NEB 688]|uniref:exonuclease domain-containing protein n=1 Tax=Arthrobacter sp. NEB 688 TaxID=904039 RepID=UPI0015630CAA|nr:exonuclease domain-containing protein [Arthrobacter sp. NEB 688]QKE83377.1 DNA polymerase III subunit epsilon [Arthrobacter sp. NEB 688]